MTRPGAVSAASPWPSVQAQAPTTPMAAAEYAQPWVSMLLGMPAVPATSAAALALVVELEHLQLALLADDARAHQRRVGWWGRLLGRDVQAQAQAQQLAAGIAAVISRADAHARLLATDILDQQQCADTLAQAGPALEGWLQAAGQFEQAAVLEPAIGQALQARRLHLQRMALIATQWQQQWLQLVAAGQQLLQRYAALRDVLLPAWRQQAALRALDPELHDKIMAELAQMRRRLSVAAEPPSSSS